MMASLPTIMVTMAVLGRMAIAVIPPTLVSVAMITIVVVFVMMVMGRIGIQQDEPRQTIQWP
jgi:hypothetical protein